MNTPNIGLSEFKEKFDVHLSRYISDKRKETARIYGLKDGASTLFEYIDRLSRQGMRLRPYIAYAISQKSNESFEKHIDLFISIELLHFAFLVHDDIIDNASIRHSMPSAQKYFQKSDALSLALLCGDLLFSWAVDSFNTASDEFDSKTGMYLRHAFFSDINMTILGEILEVDQRGAAPTMLESIRSKTQLKTAYYSFVQPLLIGGILHKLEQKSILMLKEIGLSLGYAYQLCDDVSDVVCLDKNVSKDSYLDITDGIPTVISEYMIRSLKNDELISYENFIKGFDAQDLEHQEKIEEYLISSGAVDYCSTLITETLETTERAIFAGDFDESIKQRVMCIHKIVKGKSDEIKRVVHKEAL